MASIRDKAISYEGKKTKNISDLPSVSTELETREETFTDKDGKDFTILVTTINGEDYRVPDSVLQQLQTILEERQDVVRFKVKKTGEGMATKYQVIPLG